MLGLFSLLLIQGLIFSQANVNEAPGTKYVIVLGTSLDKKALSANLYSRLQKASRYLRTHPEPLVIVTGGQGSGESLSEAEAMRRFLLKEGIAEERIIVEDQATSTYENFLYSYRILKSKESQLKGIKVIVITSDFHMFRSKFLARRVGFQPFGITAQSRGWFNSLDFGREYFAIIKSFLFDHY